MKRSTDVLIIGGGPAGVAAALAASTKNRHITLVDQNGCNSPRQLECDMIKVFAKAISSGSSFEQAKAAAINLSSNRERSQTTKHALQNAGISVVTATAMFSGPNALTVGSDQYQAKWIIIATGSRNGPAANLGSAQPSTAIALLSRPIPPKRMILLDTDQINLQLAQALATLGTTVTLITPQPLENSYISRIIKLRTAQVGSIEKLQRSYRVNFHNDEGVSSLGAEVVLAADRRRAFLPGHLGLAEVQFDAAGISVNYRGQTSNPHVLAAGSCVAYTKGAPESRAAGAIAGAFTTKKRLL